MGITIGDAILWIRGDDSQLDKDFDKAKGKSKSWVSGIGDVFKTGLGTAMGFLTAQAIPKIIDGMAGFVTEAMAAEEISAQLEAVLESTGGVAGVTADMANDLATSLSEVTRFEDDAIVAGENMLLTFTNIGKDVFPRTTETMLDMSQALGQDMKSSAIQLGKALNDPIQGVTALQRVGVSFTDAQRDQIAAMVEAGDVAGAQTLILDELQKEFGGSAVAAGQTFAGQLDILKNSLGNVQESIGEKLLPVLSGLVTDHVLPFVQQYGPVFAEWLGVNIPIAVQFLSDVWTNVLQPAIATVWAWMNGTLMPFLQTVIFPWLKEHIPIALQFLSDTWTKILWPAIQTVWNWMSTVLMPFLQNTVFPWLQTNIPKALQVLSDFWTGVLQPAIQTVWNWMSTVLIPFLQNTVFPWLQEKIPAAIQTLSDFWENTLKPAIETVWDFIQTYLVPIFETVAEIMEIGLTLAITALAGLWQNVLLPALEDVRDFVRDEIGPKLEWLKEKVFDPLTASLKTGFIWALDKINEALSFFKDLLAKIKLPPWLTPGSPTPFELGLRGISAAMDEINKKHLPELKAGLDFSAGFNGLVQNKSTTFQLTAQYALQSERSLAADIRLLELLQG